MTTDFVLDVLEQALYALRNEREGDRVHHSDRGSQYVSIRYSDRRAEARIEPSVGSTGETATTTRWPKRSTASTRPNCSIVAHHGESARPSNSPRSNGSRGSSQGAE